MRAVVTKRSILDMQICMPEYWTDGQAVLFANTKNPCGTKNGWMIRRDGDEALTGDPERQPCQQRSGHVHIMLVVQPRRMSPVQSGLPSRKIEPIQRNNLVVGAEIEGRNV